MALTMAARSALLPTTGLILCTTLVSPGNVLLNCTTAVRFLPDIATWRLIASRQSLDAGVLDEILQEKIDMAARVVPSEPQLA